jgi:hypothetical protein
MIIKKTIKYIFIALLVVAAGFFAMPFYSSWKNISSNKQEVATISNEHSQTGKVLGEDAAAPDQTNMFSSENFRTPQITFGGDAITFPAGQQSDSPEITGMHSELLMTKSDQQVKFIISWKTNKLCNSSIEYLREGQSEGRTLSEDGYGFVHSAEISPLNYSTSYTYTINATDKWGNASKSDKLAFYTGAPNVSILDLLGGAFKDMFGWAGR